VELGRSGAVVSMDRRAVGHLAHDGAQAMAAIASETAGTDGKFK